MRSKLLPAELVRLGAVIVINRRWHDPPETAMVMMKTKTSARS